MTAGGRLSAMTAGSGGRRSQGKTRAKCGGQHVQPAWQPAGGGGGLQPPGYADLAHRAEERFIMCDGLKGSAAGGDCSTSSLASSGDSGSGGDKTPPGRLHGARRPIRQRLLAYLDSVRCQILLLCVAAVNACVVLAALLHRLDAFHVPAAMSSTLSDALYFAHCGLLALQLCAASLAAVSLRAAVLTRRRGELFDGLLVAACLALAVALNYRSRRVDGFGLLIALRAWRVANVWNGALQSVRRESDRAVAKERRWRRAMQREVAKLREHCVQQECELQMHRLVALHRQAAAQQPQQQAQQPVGIGGVFGGDGAARTLNVIAEVNNEVDTSDESDPGAPPDYSAAVAAGSGQPSPPIVAVAEPVADAAEAADDH